MDFGEAIDAKEELHVRQSPDVLLSVVRRYTQMMSEVLEGDLSETER